RQEFEVLFTNWVEVKRIPGNIHAHTLSERPARSDWEENPQLRRSYRIDPTTFLSFASALNLKRIGSHSMGTWHWLGCPEILGIKSSNIVSSLLRRNIYSDFEQKGLQIADAGRTLFFPRGLVPQDKLFFPGLSRKRNWIQVVGDRSFRRGSTDREECSYHLSLRFAVRQDVVPGFVLEIKISLHLLNLQGQALNPRAANSRRRKITKGWFNDGWLNRYLAVFSFATRNESSWIIGQRDAEHIELSPTPMILKSPVSINEQLLEKDRDKELEPEWAEIIVDEEDDE
ncbi:MAG TPA: hypothetical protein VIW67_16480, partial [Terriglobales bacterium]